jgi:hypothetical protein
LSGPNYCGAHTKRSADRVEKPGLWPQKRYHKCADRMIGVKSLLRTSSEGKEKKQNEIIYQFQSFACENKNSEKKSPSHGLMV